MLKLAFFAAVAATLVHGDILYGGDAIPTAKLVRSACFIDPNTSYLTVFTLFTSTFNFTDARAHCLAQEPRTILSPVTNVEEFFFIADFVTDAFKDTNLSLVPGTKQEILLNMIDWEDQLHNNTNKMYGNTSRFETFDLHLDSGFIQTTDEYYQFYADRNEFPWLSYEPNDRAAKENCVKFVTFNANENDTQDDDMYRGWADIECTERRNFVCRRNVEICPTPEPTTSPTTFPSAAPTTFPSTAPTTSPFSIFSLIPTQSPTTNELDPTTVPVEQPTREPTHNPVFKPTARPTPYPVQYPTFTPTLFNDSATDIPASPGEGTLSPTFKDSQAALDPATSSPLFFIIIVVALIGLIAILLLFFVVWYARESRKVDKLWDKLEDTEERLDELMNLRNEDIEKSENVSIKSGTRIDVLPPIPPKIPTINRPEEDDDDFTDY